MPSLNFYAQECPWMTLNDQICARSDMYVQDIDDFNICVRLENEAKGQFQVAQRLGLDVKENQCLIHEFSLGSAQSALNN